MKFTHMKTKSKENGVLLFMENRKRIRKTVRMVLRDVRKERLQKEQLSYARAKVIRKESND